MHLVFAHFSNLVFFRGPDPPIVGASDIGQGSTILRTTISIRNILYKYTYASTSSTWNFIH